MDMNDKTTTLLTISPTQAVVMAGVMVAVLSVTMIAWG